MIDSSVWVDAFRKITPAVGRALADLLNHDLALTCGPVLLELKQGVRIHEHRRVIPLLNGIKRLPTLEADWDDSAQLGASLRRKGINLRSMDLLIAQICLRSQIPLFTLDKDFHDIPNLQLLS
jgi:predicted nucleic acid-binding protein